LNPSGLIIRTACGDWLMQRSLLAGQVRGKIHA
jgi:hypothetical protein